MHRGHPEGLSPALWDPHSKARPQQPTFQLWEVAFGAAVFNGSRVHINAFCHFKQGSVKKMPVYVE